MHPALRYAAPAIAVLALTGCSKKGDLVLDQGVGVQAVRTLCPAVGIPDYTGDITTFRSPDSRLQCRGDRRPTRSREDAV